jgi:hypothetical protein
MPDPSSPTATAPAVHSPVPIHDAQGSKLPRRSRDHVLNPSEHGYLLQHQCVSSRQLDRLLSPRRPIPKETPRFSPLEPCQDRWQPSTEPMRTALSERAGCWASFPGRQLSSMPASAHSGSCQKPQDPTALFPVVLFGVEMKCKSRIALWSVESDWVTPGIPHANQGSCSSLRSPRIGRRWHSTSDGRSTRLAVVPIASKCSRRTWCISRIGPAPFAGVVGVPPAKDGAGAPKAPIEDEAPSETCLRPWAVKPYVICITIVL